MPAVESVHTLLIASGAFKHSLSAAAACDAMARGLAASPLGMTLVQFPIADGGNGTLDAFLRHGGTRYTATVTGPLGVPVKADWGMLPDGKTAVIEMAQASGLELIDQLDALNASTFGTGELICAALDSGARRVIAGMGGSATTDGGAGCLRALGLRLFDPSGKELLQGGGALAQLDRIDASGLHPGLRSCEFIIAADVVNQAVGPNGAAAVFGPQKGARPADVIILDGGLRHWFAKTHAAIGRNVAQVLGGGAAGGFAAGLLAYTNATIRSGVDLLLDYTNFDAALDSAGLVITGEGRLDDQSLSGKGPIGVARRADARGVPVVALVGSLSADRGALYRAGIQAAWPIIDGFMTLPEALRDGDLLLERAAYRLGCTLALTSSRNKS